MAACFSLSCLSLCLCLFLSVCSSLSVSVSIPVCLSLSVSVPLSLCPCFSLSLSLFLSLSPLTVSVFVLFVVEQVSILFDSMKHHVNLYEGKCVSILLDKATKLSVGRCPLMAAFSQRLCKQDHLNHVSFFFFSVFVSIFLWFLICIQIVILVIDQLSCLASKQHVLACFSY